VLLIHESPMTGMMLLDFAVELASFGFTAIILDTPAYGLSDPLPPSGTAGPYGPDLTIADYADFVVRTADALGVHRPHVYGSHTGAMVALEIGYRHADRIGSVIVDGIPAFVRQEVIDQSRNWPVTYPPRTDGTHLVALWQRYRDHRMFYPFYRLLGQERLPLDLPDARFLHQRIVDWLHAGTDYSISYHAVWAYDGHQRLGELTARTAITAHDEDQLGMFMARLPAQLSASTVRARMPKAEHARWIADFLHGDPCPDAPPPPAAERIAGRVTLDYLDVPGGQLLARRRADIAGRTLVVLPNPPDTGGGVLDVVDRIGAHRPVLAVDLPGTGDSDALPGCDDVTAASQAVLDGLAAAGIAEFDVYARGAGAAFAVELAHLAGSEAGTAVGSMTLEHADLYTDAQRAAIAARERVDLTPETSGAHLVRAWTELRDRELFTPWFDRTVGAIRAADVPTADELHRRAFAVLKHLDTWDLPERAAMSYPLPARLAQLPHGMADTAVSPERIDERSPS
jgi:pimeloyl-ACP methyl ester carboxylesterase